MTSFKDMDQRITNGFRQHTSPVIEVPRLASILGVPFGTWWAVIRDIPTEHKPDYFMAGGSKCMMKDEAEDWCRKYVRWYPKRFGIEVSKDTTSQK